MTVKESYPIPKLEDCIDSFGKPKVFSTLDAYLSYSQLAHYEKDKVNTAFNCHTGTFEYNRMNFELANTSVSFQRTLDMILTKVKWRTCLVYIEDLIIY